jgi:serine/threonine protein kinase
LSKLRHPSTSTVMGAVVPSRKSDPMLVMDFMAHGSPWDVLQDEAITLKPDQILGMLQDVAQGLRFSHGSKPEVIHRDLKAANTLIDANLRPRYILLV